MNIKSTDLYKELEMRKSAYLEKIDKVYQIAQEFLPKINRVFVNYTGHGIEHSLNVMKYMYDLVTDIKVLSDLEITCLIYSALLHDIGMAAEEEEIEKIKADELICGGRRYSAVYEHIQKELECLQECIRPVHGSRAYEFIMKRMDKALFLVPEYTVCSFQEEVALICQAHTMDLKWIEKTLKREDVKGDNVLNSQYISMLLRIADYLDIDEKRAPIEVYQFISPKGYSDTEWKQHYLISNRNKVENSIGNRKKIVLYGQSREPQIHNKFLRYLDAIKKEISWWTTYTKNTFEEKYWLLLEESIGNKIETVGFEISDLKLNVDYHAVLHLLMGEKVYGDKKYGLRELVQNSLDACKVMQEYAPKLEQYKYEEYVPKIQIIVDYKEQKLRIRDNGIGMSEEVLTKYFLNIGKSYYKSNDYVYQGNSYRPIGNFGIGFLACFMLSNEVTVETKSFQEEKGYALELYADSEYICKKESNSFKTSFGTMISLNLESAMSVFGNLIETIVDFLQDTFLEQGISMHVEVIDKEGKRLKQIVDLKSYEQLTEEKVILDKYFDDISVAVEMIGNPCPKSKFSQLGLQGFREPVQVCKYEEQEKRLTFEDMDFSGLKKYLHNGELMLVKIEGVKKEYREKYQELLELHGNDINIYDIQSEWKDRIVFPIPYQEELIKYFDRGGLLEQTIKWCYTFVKYLEENEKWIPENFDMILEQGGFIEDLSGILVSLGVTSLLEIGDGRFLEFKSSPDVIHIDDSESAVFWKGIKLEKANLKTNVAIAGVNIGGYFVNINHKEIFPNIARDNLSAEDADNLTKQIESAAYRYLLEKEDDKAVKNALEIYLKEKGIIS